eukprot:70869-Hanusia_phi.AAC.1
MPGIALDRVTSHCSDRISDRRTDGRPPRAVTAPAAHGRHSDGPWGPGPPRRARQTQKACTSSPLIPILVEA